jgi:hypothetical protein
MFPVSPIILIFGLVMMLVAGFTVGILTGFIVVWIRKSSRRGLWKAGLAGMLGYSIVFIAMIYISAVTRSQSIFTNPALAALLAAIAAPIVREWLRAPNKTV